jgi:hypothetical protein
MLFLLNGAAISRFLQTATSSTQSTTGQTFALDLFLLLIQDVSRWGSTCSRRSALNLGGRSPSNRPPVAAIVDSQPGDVNEYTQTPCKLFRCVQTYSHLLLVEKSSLELLRSLTGWIRTKFQCAPSKLIEFHKIITA